MAGGLIRVVSEEELQAAEQADIDAARTESEQDLAIENLAGFIRNQYYIFRHHRTQYDIDERYLESLRAYNGQYSAAKRQEIKSFGGSNVFSRITTVKCRGATAMLRDVFLGAELPCALKPTPVPSLPDNISDDIEKLIAMEVMKLQTAGQPIDPQMIEDRRKQLLDAADKAAMKQAQSDAKDTGKKLQDLLVEGNFYHALAEFLIDLPIFQIAVLKGPVVQNALTLKWQDKQLTPVTEPRMFWNRVSPFDIYISPGTQSDIKDAAIIERIQMSRGELNSLIDVPGYNNDAIRSVLKDYGEGGLYDWLDDLDTERTDLELREDPQLNRSKMIDTLEWHGPILGKLLIAHGFTKEEIPDEDLDYHVTAWLIGRYIIKVQINPNPRKRHPYYISSFEKVPGSPYGHGLPETIADVQSVANASLRALVNNMSIASGPQIGLLEDRLSPSTDSDTLYPWKRWKFESDPMGAGSNTAPITFFQPDSNAQELLSVYGSMVNIADETSAIPRYMTGTEKGTGGAASTASGLSMLQNNATKVLQNVAANIDRDVISPSLRNLYDMVLLTDESGDFTGDADIAVKGVEIALKKEQDRMRRLEFLQITGNPIDMGIIGVGGRAAILRSLSEDLGLPGEDIVPSDKELEEIAAQQAMMQQEEAAAAAQGNQPPKPGSTGAGRPGEETDNAMRTRGASGSTGRG